MGTPNSALQSGEYYANKNVKTTTKESYDLEVAQKLLGVIANYLNPYLKSESALFNENC